MNCLICREDTGKVEKFYQCGWYHEDCLVAMIRQMHQIKCSTCRGEFRVVGKLERVLRWERWKRNIRVYTIKVIPICWLLFMVLTVSVVCIWHDPLMEFANTIQKPVESDSISTHVTYNTVWYLSQVLYSVDYLIGRSTVKWSYLSAVYWIALRPLWILMGILVTILDVHRILNSDNALWVMRSSIVILFIDMPMWQPSLRDFLFH